MPSTPSIRRALPSEAGVLTELALRSKAHWGYDAEFMQMARPYMVIAPEIVEQSTAFVADGGGEILGFYILAIEEGAPTLRDLWIDPALMRTGIGSALWAHMIGQARTLGYRTVRIVSEPKAEGFYLRMGARRTGLHESVAVPGRMLPVMEFEPLVTLLGTLHAVEGERGLSGALESFIADRLCEAGVWSSPRVSDGIASLRVVERGPDLLRVCGEVWQIDQTRHSFWLTVTWDHEAQHRAVWALFFDIDTTGIAPRRIRHAIDLLQDPGDVAWQITLTGREA